MASSYSTSLKIQLINNGEQSNTWGSSTNTNWNLIEQAVAGAVSIPMSNANYTMTNLNGVSDEARNMILIVSGTNNAIYQVIAPLVPKLYVITNNTSGGYAITIGASSGSLVTIPNGVTAQVYCDGSTGFYSAQTGSAGDFNVNGNETISGNLTVNGTTNIIPAGVIQMWPTGTAPSGFLLCTGTAVSRTTYAALFAVIGTTFGAGDGSTTFNLPNYTNRMPYGTTVGATGGSADAIVVSHTHTATVSDPTHSHGASSSVSDPGHSHNVNTIGASGGYDPGVALRRANTADGFSGSGTYIQNTATGISVSTSISNAATGISVSNSTTGVSGSGANLPPYLGINFIIKT